jgi:dTDP-4-amino-4,6-dideoxygalactose transaminase
MHLQPVFEQYDFIPHNADGTSVDKDIFERGLCLPSDIKNTAEDMELIIGVVRKCFGR